MTVLQDPDGMVWIGTDGGGLNRFDPQRGTFQHYRHIANEPNSLSHNSVESIYRDAAGHLWLATLAGLDRLDPVTGQFRHYQQQHGLADNMTMCVTADAQGQLWITTNSGLSRLNPRTDQFRNFGSSDGLGGNEFNSFGCHYGRSGNLYVGAVHGLNMIPTRLADAPRTTAPQVVLTGLRLFNQPLDIQPGALLATRIDRLSELTLAHSQSMVSFEFSALDYASPQAVRYAYQMTGVDDRWIETSAAQRRATYTNLPVGRHLLKLRARTEVTDWTAQPAQLAVVVLPPWWLSWWAYALYALSCGMFIFGVLRYFAARHAERMKSRFLAMMSHEIRNPLDGLLGSIELLRNAHLTSMHHEQMHTIQNAAEALLAVLDDLLDFSRAESGKLVFKMAPFNLRHLLNSQLDLIRTGATSKRLQLDLQVDQRIPEWLNGDANRLRQVLLNLLGNAVKFTDFGHIRLTVDQQSVSADRIQLHFAISDTGKGISADLQQRIFEPYHQVQASESARFRGAGLGLAVCKQLISAQHGAIGVDSIPGQGSTFWFELTFATNVSAPTLVTDDVAHNRQARRILLVEDVALNRSINSSLLEQSGHRVCCAENGKMARQILAEDAGFDVILMDVNMPEEDGITATVTIRNTAKPELAAIPIIGLTGQLNQDCIDRCEQAGMDRILAKPLRMADFNNALQALCQKSTNTAAPQHATARAALLDQAMIDSHQQVLGAERWQQIVELFVTTAADELQTLSAQLADADQAAAGATAHRLAGAVAGMGGVALQLALQQLESLLIEEQTAELHSDRIRDLVAEIQALNQQTCSALLQTK
jgi:signal transduction histidine kinase/CheY-like chemotaxis protein